MELYNVGDKIEISTYPNEKDTYFSILDAIIDDTSVVVFMPIYEWYFIKLAPGKDYYVSFISETDFSINRYKSRIVNYLKKDDYYFITFKFIGPVERIEKRGHYRFTYRLPFVYYKIGETDSIGVDLNIYYDGLILDISEGGIKFITNEEITINTYISSLITLGSDQLITDGVVVGGQNSSDAAYKFEYRVKFDKDPINQDKIIQFIFDEQRKSSKKRTRN